MAFLLWIDQCKLQMPVELEHISVGSMFSYFYTCCDLWFCVSLLEGVAKKILCWFMKLLSLYSKPTILSSALWLWVGRLVSVPGWRRRQGHLWGRGREGEVPALDRNSSWQQLPYLGSSRGAGSSLQFLLCAPYCLQGCQQQPGCVFSEVSSAPKHPFSTNSFL